MAAGDIDGNGMDDLVRKRTLPESAGGPEVVIQFAVRWARHNQATSTTTWTVCPTRGKRSRSGREGST